MKITTTLAVLATGAVVLTGCGAANHTASSPSPSVSIPTADPLPAPTTLTPQQLAAKIPGCTYRSVGQDKSAFYVREQGYCGPAHIPANYDVQSGLPVLAFFANEEAMDSWLEMVKGNGYGIVTGYLWAVSQMTVAQGRIIAQRAGGTVLQ